MSAKESTLPQDQAHIDTKIEGTNDHIDAHSPKEPAPASYWEKDPDTISLREAEAAAAAEEAAAAGQKPTEYGVKSGDVKSTASDTAKKDDDLSKVRPENIMIPKARLDEEIGKRQSAEYNATYWKGVADTARQMSSSQSRNIKETIDTAPPTKTPEAILSEIGQQKIDLAKKYNEGEIDPVEWKTQEVALEKLAQDALLIREKSLFEAARHQASVEANKALNDQTLDRQADILEVQHPYTKEITNDHHWDFLRAEAASQLAREGVSISGNLQSNLAFRERIAKLSDVYGPGWTGKTLQIPTKQQGSQPDTTGNGLSEAAAQRLKKIGVAAQQPPDTATLGSPGLRAPLTDADISKMSDDQIADAYKTGRIPK